MNYQHMKIFILLLVSLVLLQPLSSQQNDDPEALIVSGNDKIAQQDYLGAIRDLNKAVRLNPSNVKALTSRAQAKYGMGNYDEAMNDVTKVLNLDKSYAKAYYVRGCIYNGQKKYDDALADFDHTLILDKTITDASAEKAISYYNSQREKEAFEYINTLIDQQNNVPAFYYTRGILNNNKGKYEKAITDFNKAVELDPKYNPYNILLSRGLSYVSVQGYKEAEIDLTNAIQIAPNNPSAYIVRGKVYYDQGNFKEAINDYAKAVEINPDNAAPYFNLGMAYYKTNDIPNACERFHKACSMGNANACKMVVLNCSEKRK